MRPSKERRVMMRWRQQAARLLASIEIYGDGRIPARSDSPSLGIMLASGGTKWEQWNSHALQIERGARFDAVKARAYAQHLVAMTDELAVFEDWTRGRGLGPEALTSGWPGKLAREYGWHRCDACEGRGRRGQEIDQKKLMTELRRRRVTFAGSTDGLVTMLVRCEDCNGRGRIRRHGRPPGIAVGRSLARVGQRLLDTLDGRCPWAPSAAAQPSDCQACSGPTTIRAVASNGGGVVVTPCPTCRGTGNNLAGVLPGVEPSTRAWHYRVLSIARVMPPIRPMMPSSSGLHGIYEPHYIRRTVAERDGDA